MSTETALSDEDLRAIEAREAAAQPGPWRWFGYHRSKSLYLATVDRGRVHVMDFVRWGMDSAQPRFQGNGRPWLMVKACELPGWKDYGARELLRLEHPDAIFIEHAREDVARLLAEVRRLRAQLATRERPPTP